MMTRPILVYRWWYRKHVPAEGIDDLDGEDLGAADVVEAYFRHASIADYIYTDRGIVLYGRNNEPDGEKFTFYLTVEDESVLE